MTSLTYHGPYDGVFVPAAGLAVDQGASADFDDELALSLLEQPDNWAETPEED